MNQLSSITPLEIILIGSAAVGVFLFFRACWRNIKRSRQHLGVALLTLMMPLTAMAQQSMTSSATSWSGEYTVTGNVTIDSEVRLTGDATVNLAEGATLNINGRINCSDGTYHALTINGSGTMNVTGSYDGVGIIRHFSKATINGGTVNITNNADIYGYAFGSDGSNNRVVELNGGSLYSTVPAQHSAHFYGTNIVLAGGTLCTKNGLSICDRIISIADGYIYEDKATEKLYAGTLTSNEEKEILGHELAPCPDAYTVKVVDVDGVTVTADCRGAKVGDIITVTAQPTVAGYFIGAKYNDGTDHELELNDDGQDTFEMPAANVTISGTKTAAFVEGDGTKDNPFLIKDENDWSDFRKLINSKLTYEVNKDKCFKLDDDISVTSRIGANNTSVFMGTFDGGDHTLNVAYNANFYYLAPIRFVSGATIQNLHVSGTMTTENKYTAGIIGQVMKNSTVTIANCRSSVTIRSSVSGDSYHGGLVGEVASGATVNINDCVFDGKIFSTGSTTSRRCGGFVGNCNSKGTANLTNCLYAPATLAEGEKKTSFSATFVYKKSGSPKLDNCYYTQVFGTKQGTQADYLLSEDEAVPSDMDKSEILVFRREFNGGKASTICLPFEYEPAKTEGTYYSFEGIKLEGDEYVATMTAAATTLEANTPYVFMPATTDTYVPVLYHGTADYDAKNLTTTSGDWTFQGTYEQLKYGTAPMQGPVYGFASTDKVVDGVKVSAGEFVKAKDGAGVKPMRCYLIYGNASAGTRAADDLPQSITVRFLSSTGDTTGIGTLDTETGEIDFGGWYTLSGRKLDAKPTQKGLYIHNGKKIIIK